MPRGTIFLRMAAIAAMVVGLLLLITGIITGEVEVFLFLLRLFNLVLKLRDLLLNRIAFRSSCVEAFHHAGQLSRCGLLK
ncbi:MAG: hypothetical protein ACMUHY_08660, partial [Thermoplasmatota archaeon]